MEKLLLSELSRGEEEVFKESVGLYNEATRIEKLLVINNAVPGKDYTYLDLFKLAVEKLKVDQLENIWTEIKSIEYQLYDRNEIERKRK